LLFPLMFSRQTEVMDTLEATLEAAADTLEVVVTMTDDDTTTTTDTTVEAETTMTGEEVVMTGTATMTVTTRATMTEGIGGGSKLIMRLGNDWADLADRCGLVVDVSSYRDRYDRRDRSPPRRREYYE
jgi:hypothetical protein